MSASYGTNCGHRSLSNTIHLIGCPINVDRCKLVTLFYEYMKAEMMMRSFRMVVVIASYSIGFGFNSRAGELTQPFNPFGVRKNEDQLVGGCC